jgi:DNA-directed RNA polymerase subunit K/omega
VKKYIKISKLHENRMDNYLTKFERCRVLGERATQIANGAPVTVDVTGINHPLEMAEMELNARTIPITITRTYPNGKSVTLKVCEMIY